MAFFLKKLWLWVHVILKQENTRMKPEDHVFQEKWERESFSVEVRCWMSKWALMAPMAVDFAALAPNEESFPPGCPFHFSSLAGNAIQAGSQTEQVPQPPLLLLTSWVAMLKLVRASISSTEILHLKMVKSLKIPIFQNLLALMLITTFQKRNLKSLSQCIEHRRWVPSPLSCLGDVVHPDDLSLLGSF